MFNGVRLLLRILGLARPQAWSYAGAVALGVAVSALYFVAGFFVARVFTRILDGDSVGDVAWLIMLALAATGVRAVIIWLNERWTASLGNVVKSSLRERLFSKLMQLGPYWRGGEMFGKDQARTGLIQSLVVESVERVETLYNSLIVKASVALLTGLIGSAILIIVDPVIGLIVLAAVLTIPLIAIVHVRIMGGPAQFWYGAYMPMYAEYLDAIQGLPTLKAFNSSKRRADDLAQMSERLRKAAIRLSAAEIVSSGGVALAIGIASAMAIGVGALRVSAGEMGIASLFFALLVSREAVRPGRAMLSAVHYCYGGVIVAPTIFALLEAEPEVKDSGERLPEPRRADLPSISFENVSFRYAPGDADALDGVTIRVAPGETVAIVGRSGAGKSTMVALLLRFLDPQSGRVAFDGTDLREVSIDQLRSQIAIVSQDTYLFYGTVRENLLFARPDAGEEKLIEAAKAARAHEFIARLPNGYDTLIGERGLKLSGGERQRLAIARALLRDAPLLVLDEATSSVDVANESAIKAAIERATQGRTTIIIAHRLSTVATADRIVVLERGKVVEEGSPEELMKAGGDYARLVALQGGRD